MDWLLYGAYGYTGRLIAGRAVERGLRPVLAGRGARRTEALGRELDLPVRVFSLDEPTELAEGLRGIRLVLHAAGPFSRTFRPMVDACLRAEAHYLDITGEIAVLEAAFGLHQRAVDAGVVVLPGVGFDVVPSDCAAVRAARAIEDPARLEIAFVSGTGPSRGTLKSQLEGIARPAAIRKDGALVEIPHGSLVRRIPFADGTRTTVCIPWGDLSTAYRSTGIGNIRTYMAVSPWLARLAGGLSGVLAVEPLRRGLERLVDRFHRGPGPEARRSARSRVLARVAGAGGQAATVEYVLPDGYTFTAHSAVAVVECLRDGTHRVAPEGTTTPALLFGPGFVEELDGVERVQG